MRRSQSDTIKPKKHPGALQPARAGAGQSVPEELAVVMRRLRSLKSENAKLKDLAVIQPQLLYSRRQAARLLAISVRSLDYLIATNRISCKRVGGRVLLTLQALQNFADHA